MERSLIIGCYSKNREINDSVSEFIKNFPQFSSPTKLSPEFIQKSEVPETRLRQDSISSISNTVTFCSKLTRIQIDRVLYKEILLKREEYQIFLELEEENPILKQWYYFKENGAICGPLNSFEMNKLYLNFQINEKTKIKKKSDDDYFFLSRLVKRYYKKVLEKKLNLEKEKGKISNKIQRFRKGKIEFKYFNEKETFAVHNREERVHSLLVKPNLVYLTDEIHKEEDDENCFTRLRSSTNYIIGK
jgi:hypothetical protein